MIKQLLINFLEVLAKNLIEKKQPKVIGITGSVGKTSTKEAICYVLQHKNIKAHCSYGNLNTEIGLPLAILQFDFVPYRFDWIWTVPYAFGKYLYYLWFDKYPKVLILEYGADHKGDIEKLTKIVRADIAVITEVGESHLEYFKTVKEVAKEKIKLAKNLNPDGIAILNQDNKYIVEQAKNVFFEKIWYHGSCIKGSMNAAIKVASIFNISDVEARKILDNYKNVKGRLVLFKGKKGSTIIDDTYNSNPLSVKNALEKVRQLFKDKKYERKIIVLGDMLELGKDEKQLHQKVAREASKIANVFLTFGDRFEDVKQGKWFDEQAELTRYLLKNMRSGDLILIKGSQGMRMEKIVEEILADKKDCSKLVRQSKYWKNKKFIKP